MGAEIRGSDEVPERRWKTDELVAAVIAAGGRLSLPDETTDGGVNWRQRAYAAQRHGRVPRGKRLSVSRTATTFEIELLDASEQEERELGPVPVPTRLGKHHPVAKEFRNRVDLHVVSRKALPRALRIVHALATEAEKRGYRASCVPTHFDSFGHSEWKPSRAGQLVFTIGGHELPIRLSEKGVGLRGPYERQMARWREDREKSVRDMLFVNRPKPYDSGASGELNIESLAWSPRRTSWGDRQRWRLEDRLPHLLRELETQADEAEERRLAKEREAAERQRQWEAAIADAKRRLALDHKVKALRAGVAAWSEAEAIRAYCRAIEERYESELVDDQRAAAWLSFAHRYADQLQQLPRPPDDPEATPEALKPYLGGWSPYGPQS